MLSASNTYDSILWLSFGAPESLEDVMAFLRNVTRGRGVPDSRLEVVAEQYRFFGGASPLNQQNRLLIARLTELLHDRGMGLPVFFGNRNWTPYASEAVAEMLAAGHRSALVFATSAYGSFSACRQYRQDMLHALEANGAAETLRLEKIRHFYNHPLFIEALTQGVAQAIAKGFDPLDLHSEIIATAHSIPQSMADASEYVAQLQSVRVHLARSLQERFGFDKSISQAYQSRSGAPSQPWLEPDISVMLEGLASQGTRQALVVPIGFISDHQEVRYDLDVLAAQTAQAFGISLYRAPTASNFGVFMDMVVELVGERTQGWTPRSVDGVISGDSCAQDCCILRASS